MYTTHNMHLGYGFVIIFFYNIHHLLQTKFPAFVPVGIEPAVATKIAGKYTDIGWFYMKIAIEIGDVAMLLFAYEIGQRSYKTKAGIFKKE